MVHLDYESPIISEMFEGFDTLINTELAQGLTQRLQIVTDLGPEEERSVLNLMISEAFTKYFLGLLGDYNKFIICQPQYPPQFQVRETF